MSWRKTDRLKGVIEALKESEATLQLTLGNISDAIFITEATYMPEKPKLEYYKRQSVDKQRERDGSKNNIKAMKPLKERGRGNEGTFRLFHYFTWFIGRA